TGRTKAVHPQSPCELRSQYRPPREAGKDRPASWRTRFAKRAEAQPRRRAVAASCARLQESCSPPNLPAEDIEAMRLDLHETIVRENLGVARPLQRHRHDFGYARWPPGEQDDTVSQIDSLLQIVGDEDRRHGRQVQHLLKLIAHEQRHLVIER